MAKRTYYIGCLILGLFIFSNTNVNAQSEPVKWFFKASKVAENIYDLVITAKVEDGWYLYSQNFEQSAGPIPTSFTFSSVESLKLLGKVSESGKKITDIIDSKDKIYKFSDKARFTQRVELTPDHRTDKIGGSVTFMSCNGSTCLPPKQIPFEFVIR